MRTVATGLFLLLVAAAACSKNSDPTTVGYWEAQLKSKRTRVEALRELGKLGKKEAVPVILPYLAEEGPWQAEAANALGLLGDPSAVPALIEHIDYEAQPKADDEKATNHVRTNLGIIHALVMLRADSARAPLVKLLKNPEPKTREANIAALGQLGAKEAVPTLLGMLATEKQVVLAAAAVKSLGQLGTGDPQVAATLVKYLYDDTLYDSVRYALVELGPGAVPKLVESLGRHNPDVEALRTADGKPLPEGSIEARAAAVLGATHAASAEAPVVEAFERLSKRLGAKPKEAPPSLRPALVELVYAL
ncbi:MAG TPA: HEAT repeat domain-containing protein, partial [Myxococcota bacterium]|nr:HEAT repeat domain-containing protein [Myxococcota bacterium]